MRALRVLLFVFIAAAFTQCKKEGCTDPNANNYNTEAKKSDGSCTYPVITVRQGGDDGDVTGRGGNATATHTWNNSLNQAELNMDITSSKGGTYTIVVLDADNNEVLNETLTAGVGDDSLTQCSAAGVPGEWKVTITLSKFNGDGSFTLSAGC
ncbi:hypothetical protein [Luteibaculum oceani]|uniref:Uncharacterized protein n=1 Tax=Luteibaculum oceani TaxID=1294296 RepID=A0A5C6V004_9FLAO|nr:hypothetical protein [Luteibaculum oceani]TXC78817.1 hypothetical protein FRX97_06290 [Luteibaculum oceani]